MAMGKIVRVGATRGRKLSYTQVKQVQKIVNSNKRLKSYYKSLLDANIITTGVLTELSSVPEGEDYNQRDSDEINASSLRVQWSLVGDGGNSAALVRVLIVRATKGVLAAADMPTAGGEPNLDIMQVLYDELAYIPASPANDGVQPLQKFYFKSFKNKKVPHMKISFVDGESATAAQNNGLYFYTISTTATNGPAIAFQSKLKFFDRS